MAFNINPMARTLAMFVNSLRPKKIAIYGAVTCPKIALHSNNYKKCTSYD